jgi:Ca-activated chloride channel family protein
MHHDGFPRPIVRVFGILFCASVLLTSPASEVVAAAQSPRPTVSVLVSVSDKKGSAISNLTAADFKVREDGKAQVITKVDNASTSPLSILFLVDQSGSTINAASDLKKVLNAAVQFIRSSMQPGRDKVALATFQTTVNLQQDFTDNVDQFVQTMSKTIGRVGGGTAFNDAIYGASTLLERRAGRRLILVVGDGYDTASRFSRSDAIKAARKADVWIVAIALQSPQPPGPFSRGGDQSLEAISEESGGRFFKSSDLKQFDKIREELQAQYLLQYESTNSNLTDDYRAIRVETVDKNYKARHRSGYWVR